MSELKVMKELVMHNFVFEEDATKMATQVLCNRMMGISIKHFRTFIREFNNLIEIGLIEPAVNSIGKVCIQINCYNSLILYVHMHVPKYFPRKGGDTNEIQKK